MYLAPLATQLAAAHLAQAFVSQYLSSVLAPCMHAVENACIYTCMCKWSKSPDLHARRHQRTHWQRQMC